MKLADYEGKTIKEIDRQNNSKTGFNLWLVLAGIIAGILLVLVGYGIAGFSMHGQLERLQADITTLKIENGLLQEEKALLQRQLTEKQAASETAPVIYHDVKYQDTLGSISVKYYGTDGYAAELARFNGLTVRSILRVGQVIKVPREPLEGWSDKE